MPLYPSTLYVVRKNKLSNFKAKYSLFIWFSLKVEESLKDTVLTLWYFRVQTTTYF